MKKITNLDLSLKEKNYPSYNDLIKLLVELGYNRVNMVLDPDEFSVRGSIIDIYPETHSHPIRLEYDDDELHRLNSFDTHSQRSLSKLKKTSISKVDTERTKQFSKPETLHSTDLLSEFFPGDYIVHEKYGIGQFEGLERKNFYNKEVEYIILKYANDDTVFVPLTQLRDIYKYSYNNDSPKVNSLNDGAWKKTKTKVKKSAENLAKDIFLIQKVRMHQKGYAFKEDTERQLELENQFEHKLTKDQETATKEIKKDMERTKPMDRLICGDVGYGKTELILRAAFKALESGKQVALLVPTTILAEQHYKTFKKRFKPFGYRVEVLSRFRKKNVQSLVIDQLKGNACDLVIGTHRILSKSIEFADLGLILIDEEQRFGVSHKETLKRFKKLVDVIAVSATPIPRTLYMSLTGTKDISVIATPPVTKKNVLTYVGPHYDNVVKKAITDELKRKGQVFYVHNRIQSIHSIKIKLENQHPKAIIEVTHAQLDEKILQEILVRFLNKEIDILITTTIIENGIDIPNVNTIIMDRAEQFGLSQIHQLRGRVGRSSIQAYAYILYSKNTKISKKAEDRLQAIREYASLGSGYELAMKDLEIRGAGNLLGSEQSGHIISVGFGLYCKLLEDSINEAKGNRSTETNFIDIPIELITIDNQYIPNIRERLSIYRRLLRLRKRSEIKIILEELEDRYGQCPQGLYENIMLILNEKE
jgi:transcription-repair coupling factor (superfamily II helicase)